MPSQSEREVTWLDVFAVAVVAMLIALAVMAWSS